ncbi:zinc-dependent alcohol dehydrogenase family protein [Mucilaginibacter sp. X4EP1]|uniref:zinc-dependent alcohol dehydrogenase family protein n=1 Tax=Mucilaginibacter sp. X4EP1 TaxID=2723092 RepID=UPI0021672968|nr:NAD(P)-dependent alcohol dehydrogenase [Mucilaginibacter sp. X4EP1]MCS3814027.1 NADPH:quinone reductase-like Zn-dependent oxidoreductase [Mucilaginibacter sp. X4EP1]
MQYKTYQITESYSVAGLNLVKKDQPKLGPNEVLIKMKAWSLNYRDLLVIKGIDAWKPPVGRIPVSDGVGVIVETGSEVTSLVVDDRVAGLFFPNWIDGKMTDAKLTNPLGGKVRDGLLQEYVVLNENELIKVPAFLTDVEAATLPCAALTAWHGLMEKGQIQPGNIVLIQGTGGVSLFSVQFALMAGAEVILLSGSDEKLQMVGQMGVNHLINYKRFPNWEDRIMDITNGLGVDHVVEVVGGDHINKSIDAVALDGTISIIGLINGFKGNINTAKIMSRQVKLQGINVGSKEMFNRMNKALEIYNIRPVIDKVFAFEEAKEALTLLESASHFGKLCISV